MWGVVCLSLLDVPPMFPQEFEKDDDSNGHVDFITSASVSTRKLMFFRFSAGIQRFFYRISEE